MVIFKVREDWNFNELVLHAALWRFMHVDGPGGGYQDDDESRGVNRFKVRPELSPSGEKQRETLLFQTLAPPTWSAPRSAVDTLQMKPAAPALPGGARKTQSDRINGWNNEEEETAGRWLHLRVWDCRGCGRKALQSEDRATNVIWGEDENAFKKPNSVSRWDKTRRSEAGTAPRGELLTGSTQRWVAAARNLKVGRTLLYVSIT